MAYCMAMVAMMKASPSISNMCSCISCLMRLYSRSKSGRSLIFLCIGCSFVIVCSCAWSLVSVVSGVCLVHKPPPTVVVCMHSVAVAVVQVSLRVCPPRLQLMPRALDPSPAGVILFLFLVLRLIDWLRFTRCTFQMCQPLVVSRRARCSAAPSRPPQRPGAVL